MITSVNLTGSLNPPTFSVNYEHTRFSNFSAADLAKLPVQTIQRIIAIGKQQTTEQAVNERGEINCFCYESSSDSIIRGFFVGESEFYLNETIIQVFDLFGTIVGRRIQDEYTLKLEGNLKNRLFEGRLTGDVLIEGSADNKLQSGRSELNFLMPNIEKVLLSPTAKAVPVTTIYPNESVRTEAYQWRESIDREIVFLRDELLKLIADLNIDTVRSSRLQELYGRFLKLSSTSNFTPETVRAMWRATMKFAVLGATQQAYEQSLIEFTGVLPTVKTFLDKNLFIINEAQVGKCQISSGIVYNTITIIMNNPNNVQYDKVAVVQYLKNVKPMHLKIELICDNESFEIL